MRMTNNDIVFGCCDGPRGADDRREGTIVCKTINHRRISGRTGSAFVGAALPGGHFDRDEIAAQVRRVAILNIGKHRELGGEMVAFLGSGATLEQQRCPIPGDEDRKGAARVARPARFEARSSAR